MSLLKTVTKLHTVAEVGQKVASRNLWIVSGPPQRKVSKAERCVIGACYLMTVLATPMWVLYNIPSYSKKPEE